MHLKLRQLEVFKAVMETGSVSSAAARLSRTQPAVSVAIASFEEELGFPLFHRAKGRFVATPEAELLYEEVTRGLLAVERIGIVAREIRDGGLGHLRVAADGAPSINFMPRVIAEFTRSHGDVRIDLHTRSSKQILAWVAARQIDVGIVEMPTHLPGVDFEPFSQACVCIMPEGHPLCVKTVVRPVDLAAYPVISILENHPINAQLQAAFFKAGCALDTRIAGYYFATCRNLVGHGAGLAIVDAMNGDDALGGGVVSRPFQPVIRHDMALIRARARAPSSLAEAFTSALRNALLPYRLR
jgi:DNA-binding transcriptional LysR family regulator